ncbi:MAG TPA: heavy metal-responsive transcriptional regulator [Bacteroidetes bacterium]|nr:HTH-type transcriptional regulator ZntR [bacterium BMS3Bbin04]HDO65679.1 heavy metal-responsive transcriptional regulator [Bacteroidota bacterium]HEX04804.1 heavy metal-responsive transcriptional regulator [Bacteroidota bacterium]
MSTYSVGQIAKMADVNIETLRFYETKGLMPEPKRRESGYRDYGEHDLERMLFIGRAKQLGFTLKEIEELLNLRVDTKTTCADVRLKAETKIKEIEKKIHELVKFKSALQSLAKSCMHGGPATECPILEALHRG